VATSIIKREINKNPKIHGPRVHWSEKQKLEAVSTYLMVGKWAIVSDATNIPIDTLKGWKSHSTWWKEYEKEVRASSRLEVSGKLAKIIAKSSDLVLDRLENGDVVLNTRTGEVVRREINAKVASEILHKSIDKQVVLDKIVEAPEIHQEAIMDRLKSIQDTLRKNIKKAEQPIIDVEVTSIETHS